MATQYNVKPGTFETITGESIGSFTLDVWKHFELSGNFKHLMANLTIKSGGATVPGSAYELATDGDATTQESGETGATLYGMMRITNASYAGTELTIDGQNFGCYTDIEGTVNYIDTQGAGKTAPGSDSFIEDGEPAIFNSDTGLSIVSDNTGEVTAWDAGTSYSVAGTLARTEGFTASATGASSNQNKYPLLAENNSFWYLPKNERELMRLANSGEVVVGEVHPIHDRAGTNYNQNIQVGDRSVNGDQYEMHLIHLDGTLVSGNTTLETILGIGQSWQNPYIDIIAPDVAGTRTLIDAGDYVVTPQSSSGDADTVGALVEDQMQQITGEYDIRSLDGGGDLQQSFAGALSVSSGAGAGRASVSTSGSYSGDIVSFDSSDSPDARTGTTTHGKRLTGGAAYIISMIPK